jgi:DNA (cytosine-5)-methyltransferase 1
VDTRTVNLLSICSGIGGLDLGLRSVLPTRTVCMVEREIGVASILAARMEDGTLDQAPIWSDILTFDPEPWRGRVDLIAGSPPCQPWSTAGQQRGASDERNLWPAVARIAEGLGHPALFLENVASRKMLSYYYHTIRPQLRGMGYSTQEGLFTAAEAGAPHKRQRLFILAHRNGCREAMGYADTGLGDHEAGQVRAGRDTSSYAGGGHALAHASSAGSQTVRWSGEEEPVSPEGPLSLYPPGPNDHAGWARLLAQMPSAQPVVCVLPDGPAPSVARRLRALGNAVVPAVGGLAWIVLSSEKGGNA